jgi:hypothetical protein
MVYRLGLIHLQAPNCALLHYMDPHQLHLHGVSEYEVPCAELEAEVSGGQVYVLAGLRIFFALPCWNTNQ